MSDLAPRKKRDPLFGAAVLKRTFQQRNEEQSPAFKTIYEGVLRDLNLTDDQVEAYLAAHTSEVDEAIKPRARGEMDEG